MDRNLDKITEALDLFSEGGENGIDECVNDLLTDLRHLCHEQEMNFDKTVAMSEIHFNYEAKPFKILPSDNSLPYIADEPDAFLAITECDNCGKQFKRGELKKYRDFFERVEVGKEIPAGDCPDCGAFCYLVKPKLTLVVGFGSDPESKLNSLTTKEFHTEIEKKAYIDGLYDGDGWLDYAIYENEDEAIKDLESDA
uniref:Uncharacterized protein n=1 Tax=viral metagenome TaxID=1070528 RepID=A0A6M3ILS2_9ZZZZ